MQSEWSVASLRSAIGGLGTALVRLGKWPLPRQLVALRRYSRVLWGTLGVVGPSTVLWGEYRVVSGTLAVL